MNELLADLDRWQRDDEQIALATLVAVRGSAPRLPGSRLVVRMSCDCDSAGPPGWVVLHVLQVSRPGDLTLDDPKVVNAYRQRIGELKQRKAEYTLRLRALDETDLRPERVRTELRELILTTLKQARRELRKLGLH